MSATTGDKPRQAWARLGGFLYLLTNVTATYAFYLSSRIIVKNDAVQTAANMQASESLFRIGVACELVTVAGVVALIVALYVVLEPVGRGLALLAAFWRLIENCVLAAITFSTFTALAILSSADYAGGGDTRILQGLISTLLRVHAYGFQVGFLFLGLGSALFSWLWLKSLYIPRWLAAWGIFASLLMAVVALIIIVWPAFYEIVTMAYMAPMGIYEIGLGLWLLVKGIRIPAAGEALR